MVLEELSTVLTMARVVFIKKIDQTKVPGDYRPISITFAITRAFHRILARRLCHSLTFSQLQYAFLQKNGCLEASSLLYAILRKAHDNTKPVAMAFLDLAKAYDTISHEIILEEARVSGVPLINYLKHLYEHSAVLLGDAITRYSRGLRQRDPLSPVLFILAIDIVVKISTPLHRLRTRRKQGRCTCICGRPRSVCRKTGTVTGKTGFTDGALKVRGIGLKH